MDLKFSDRRICLYVPGTLVKRCVKLNYHELLLNQLVAGDWGEILSVSTNVCFVLIIYWTCVLSLVSPAHGLGCVCWQQ